MSHKSDKRVAVVTGGNRGLGYGTARQLAEQGYKVVLTARHPSKGEEAAEELCRHKLDVLFHTLDVTRDDSVAQFGEFVQSHCGRVDVLVNNAGVLNDGSVGTGGGGMSVFNVNLDIMRGTLDVNLYGPLRLAQELVPVMKHQHYGRVVNISSGMGQLSEMGGRYPAYRISKTALNALTRILAAETAGYNILVNSICPGWVRTDMGGPSAERSVEQAVQGIVWAATLPDDGPTGGFFRDGQRIEW